VHLTQNSKFYSSRCGDGVVVCIIELLFRPRGCAFDDGYGRAEALGRAAGDGDDGAG